MKKRISFLMTTFNDTSLLKRAIESVRHLPFDDWEMLILDNSNESEEPWKMVESYISIDDRIRAWKSVDENNNRKNIGWCKGTSYLLDKVEGEYVTFLAADDILDGEGVKKVYDSITENKPDVVIVGMAYTQLVDGKLQVIGMAVPENKVYCDDNRVETIQVIMDTSYYNSMFHYCRVDFLKKNNIDFYSPYYGDNASMTAALARAEKIVAIDEIVYYLTYNTSQTRGYYIIGGYTAFASQWEEICKICDECKNIVSDETMIYIANRIVRNFIGVYEILESGDNFRDMEMNPLNISENERQDEINRIFENDYIKSLLSWAKK